VEKYATSTDRAWEALNVFGTELPERATGRSFPTFCGGCARTKQFDYCVDVTAAHYPKREKAFDVILDPLFFCAQ